MKKFFFISALFLLTAVMVNAQVSLYAGPKAGFALTSLSADDAVEDQLKQNATFTGGAFLNIKLIGLAIQPEVLYIQKSADIEDTDNSIKQSYLEIPVLVKFYPVIPGPLSVNVFAGPSFGFNLDTEFDFEGGSVSDDDAGSTIALSAVVGGGVDFNLEGGSVLMLDARYNFGLSGVFDADNVGENFEDSKYSGFAFYLGVGFKL